MHHTVLVLNIAVFWTIFAGYVFLGNSGKGWH